MLIPSQTSTVLPLKFGNGQAISSHTSLGMWLLFRARIKVIHCQQKGPQALAY